MKRCWTATLARAPDKLGYPKNMDTCKDTGYAKGFERDSGSTFHEFYRGSFEKLLPTYEGRTRMAAALVMSGRACNSRFRVWGFTAQASGLTGRVQGTCSQHLYKPCQAHIHPRHAGDLQEVQRGLQVRLLCSIRLIS